VSGEASDAATIQENRIKRLHELDAQERALMKSFILRERRAQRLDIKMPVLASLMKDDILQGPGSGDSLATLQAMQTGKRSYMVSDWAWEYLSNHPEALGQ
jgi:hypothetical protein